jgi:adenosylcobinamide-GDP ribazoletransferase
MTAPIITAIRTLTIIPIPGKETKKRWQSVPWFPVVGLLIGLLLYYIGKGLTVLSIHSLISGLIITLISVSITGALHLDGFADIADAFGGGHSREQIFTILKDSRLGTFGTTALFFNCATRIILAGWCITNNYPGVFLLSAVLSRTMIAIGCSFFPYVSHAKGNAISYTSDRIRFLWIPSSIGCLLFAVLISGLYNCLPPLVISFPVPLVFLSVCLKKIGGITGDCLGAVNEITELTFFFSMYFFFTLNTAC